MMNLISSLSNQEWAPSLPPARGNESEEEAAEFAGELAMVGMMASQPKAAEEPAAKNADSTYRVEGMPSELKLYTRGAGMKQAILDDALGTNAVAMNAGLKPWSKEWVFEKNPEEVKPLFESKAGSKIDLGDLIDKLSPQLGAAHDSELTAQADALRGMGETRGDAGLAKQPGGVSVSELPQIHEMNGNVESVSAFGLDRGVEGKAKQKGIAKNAGAHQGTAALSGDEFLNTLTSVRGHAESGKHGGMGEGAQQGDKGLLTKPALKVIEGDKGRKAHFEGNLSAASLQGLNQPKPAMQAGPFGKVLDLHGQVTQGAMTRDRLSTDAVHGLSTGIRNLNLQGGGEIRVKLRPENLGELHLRVVTNGKDVGIHIQASDEGAKRILEESMSSLKDSLAAQNLNLGRVDLSVAQGANNASGGDLRDMTQQQGSQSQAFMQDGNRHEGSNGRNEYSREYSEDSGRRPEVVSARRFTTAAPRASSANGRLDVTA